MYVPFQIIPIQMNLPQVNFTCSVVTYTSNMNAAGLNLNCPRNEYLCNGIILVFSFNKLAKMFKTCSLLYNYGVWSVD